MVNSKLAIEINPCPIVGDKKVKTEKSRRHCVKYNEQIIYCCDILLRIKRQIAVLKFDVTFEL